MNHQQIVIQGDVLFLRVQTAPEPSKRIEDGVVERGEGTGHCHRIPPQLVAAVLFYVAANGNRYIKNADPLPIVHDIGSDDPNAEKHKDVVLPAGEWQVVNQKEYTPTGYARMVD